MDALLLGPSHSIGLQAADLVVGSAREVRGVGRVEWPRDPGRQVDLPGKLVPA